MSVAKVRPRKNGGFGVVSAAVMQNTEISSDGRFLLALASTLPPDWEFRISWLRDISGWGVERLRNTMNELVGADHLIRHRGNDKHGRISWDFEFLLEPEPQAPETD